LLRVAETKLVTDHADRGRDGTHGHDAERAREYVLDSHAEVVEAVLECVDAVADDWDSAPNTDDRRWTTDPSKVADPLRAELEASGAWARLPDVLAGAVRAAGYSLSASPVADPPYVTATSRGPMLRATVPDGRLVVLLRVFEIYHVDGGPRRYVRGPETPEDVVRVTFE
jgi:hypothetical protein